jgi:hypothetical protein
MVTVRAMPSHTHEALVQLFSERPEFAPEMLTGPMGVNVPWFEWAASSSADLTNAAPVEYRADVVITLTAKDSQQPVYAIVVEAQLKADVRKRRSWPAYVANLHARLDCPVSLLVICPNPAVARWCAVPIAVGNPGLTLHPLVLGPETIPVVTDFAVATGCPELSVLSALAHGPSREHVKVLHAFAVALDSMADSSKASYYADVVLSYLPNAARKRLESLVSITLTSSTECPYTSEFARRIYMLGEARALFAILDARGIKYPDEARETVATCTDPEQLIDWARQASTATTIDDVWGLAEPQSHPVMAR